MNRTLAVVALMTFGGCQCFDAAFAAYCEADAGRCANRGPVVALTDGDARACLPLTVVFYDHEGVATEVSTGTLNIVSPTGARVSSTEGCDVEMTRFRIERPVRRFDFSVRADTFGVHSLRTSIERLPEWEGIFTANANLNWLPPMAAEIPPGTCAPAGRLEIRDPVMGAPITSPLSTDIVLTGDGVLFGLSAGSCVLSSGARVSLPPDTAELNLFARTFADAGTDLPVSAVAESFGLIGQPMLQLYSECRGMGAYCTSPTHCCSGNCTADGGCVPP